MAEGFPENQLVGQSTLAENRHLLAVHMNKLIDAAPKEEKVVLKKASEIILDTVNEAKWAIKSNATDTSTHMTDYKVVENATNALYKETIARITDTSQMEKYAFKLNPQEMLNAGYVNKDAAPSRN